MFIGKYGIDYELARYSVFIKVVDFQAKNGS